MPDWEIVYGGERFVVHEERIDQVRLDIRHALTQEAHVLVPIEETAAGTTEIAVTRGVPITIRPLPPRGTVPFPR